MTDSKLSSETRKAENLRLLLAAAMFLIYVLLLGKVNFVVLTSIFLSASSSIFFKKRFVLLVLSAIGVTVGIYYLFARAFLLPLP